MIVSLALMLMILLVGVVSAGADSTSMTDEERLELANKLWGTDITYGEYIGQLFPEAYEKSPDTTTKAYYDMKVVWMDPSEESSDSKHRFSGSTGEKDIPYAGIGDAELDYDGSEITYKIWSRMVFPTSYTVIPSMSVLEHLWRDDGNNQEIVGIEFESENNVYKIEAEDTYDYSSPDYYRVIGQYSGVFPTGVVPQTFSGVDSTNWEYVS